MDDLVKRLRSGGAPQVGGKLMTWEKQCAEAADEIERLRSVSEWADRLAETLMVVNSQHGGRHAARLLKDYRDFKASTITHQEPES